MPTAVPALYMTPAIRRRRGREGFALAGLVALLPILLAVFVTAATHQGRVTSETLKHTLLQAGEAIAAAEAPQG